MNGKNEINNSSIEESAAYEHEINFNSIPVELKEYDQWVLWKYIPENGKHKKIPYSIHGSRASPTNSETWSSFEEISSKFQESEDYTGIGFVFTESDPFVGIDWDHIRDAEKDLWNIDILDEIKNLETYAEVSPSGTGVHAIVKGERDPKGRKRKDNREIYDSQRYFTVTGDVISGVPAVINDINEVFDSIQEKVGYEISATTSTELGSTSTVEDDEIIRSCRSAANREKFNDIFEGKWEQYYESPSQADISLCDMLALRTQNEEQMDRIFRKSGLYREKWERKDYSGKTIQNAIDYVHSKNTWQGVELPAGYIINEKGLHSNSANHSICRTPIVVSAIGMDIDTDEFWYRITFQDPLGNLKEKYVKQEELTKKSSVMKLSNQGIIVTDKKAGDLCEYLADSIHSSSGTLPVIRFVQKNGWKNGNEMFVIGNMYHTYDESGAVEQIDEEIAEGLKKRGTLEDWVNGVEEIINEPITRFKCYCAASAMLLRLLDVQSYIVDHTGDSTTGKTLSTSVAFSMFGNPSELVFTAKSTSTYLEHKATTFTDLPLFVDETSLQHQEFLKELIYMIANETGKGRGKKDGGVRKLNRWKTVTFTTGEKPIVDADGYGGQQVRVIEIQQTLPKMKHAVKLAKSTISNNYGHVSDLFIRKLFDYKGELSYKFAQYEELFTNNESATMNRMGDKFAVIAVAGELLEDVFAEIGIESKNHVDLVDAFFTEIVKENPIVPYPVIVLRAVNEWVEENKGYFLENECEESYRKYGWITDDGYLDIIPKSVKDAMKQQGMEISSAIDTWIEKGIMVCNSGRKDYRSTHRDEESKRVNVYRFDMQKMQEYIE
ncbi:DUF927 domain-containing protein [Methanohalophilus sp. WG1-DM]|uniref:phage NrS-1 polymerase family protein n=1 Tax=Methanohalophilus sp. WG1-DM TaxID=2491675 RepID=UPI000FFF4741|nr:DUF927 domain-containing protein [Methanohalophilus sp. WG1-DM]RXG35030.1 hypothetical protein CI957_54 [Methanohalophilus sp. WG1-DM]